MRGCPHNYLLSLYNRCCQKIGLDFFFAANKGAGCLFPVADCCASIVVTQKEGDIPILPEQYQKANFSKSILSIFYFS